MYQPASFYLVLCLVLAAIFVLMIVSIVFPEIILAPLRCICFPTSQTYTLFVINRTLGSIVINAKGASIYIEGTRFKNSVTIIKYRGSCNGGINAKVENNTLKITVHAYGCCDVIVRLPVGQYNIVSDISVSRLELRDLVVNKLVLKAAAASVKISNLSVNIANISAIVSSLEADNINISNMSLIYASASSLRLELLNRGILATVQKSEASSISVLCPTSRVPVVRVTALASTVEISCVK